MSNVTLCKFLYTNPPACDKTYAESLGSGFTALAVILAFVFSVQLCLSILISYRIYVLKGLSSFDTQVKIFCLQNLSYLVWIPRIIDTCGFRDWIPYVVILLSYDWVTCAIISMIYLVVFDWVRILMKVSGQQHRVTVIRYVFITVPALLWIGETITSTGQGVSNEQWKWHAAKIIIDVIALGVIIIVQTFSGLSIFRILYKNEQRWKKKKAKGSARTPNMATRSMPSGNQIGDLEATSPRSGIIGGLSSTNTMSSGNLDLAAASSGNVTEKQAGEMAPMSKKKSSQVYRILKLMALCTTLELIVIILMIVAIQSDLNDKYTKDVPRNPPSGTSDMLYEAVFDILGFCCLFVSMFFFRPSLKGMRRANKKDDTSSTTETGNTANNTASTNRLHASRRKDRNNSSIGGGPATETAVATRQSSAEKALASMSEVDEKAIAADEPPIDVAHVSPTGARRSIVIDPQV